MPLIDENIRHIWDDEARNKLTSLCEQIARSMLARELWRTSWRVEVDGCVYKFKIDGYPRWRTPHWYRVEEEKKQALAEFENDGHTTSSNSD
jgi:hypothetical protein